MAVRWNEFVHTLEVLERIKREISPEAAAVQYKKAIQQKKDTAISQINELIPQIIYSGMKFGEDKKAHHCITEMRKRVRERMDAELNQKICDAIFNEFNADRVVEILIDLHHELIRDIYADYWVSECKPCNAPGYSYYNGLIEHWYSTEEKVWKAQVGDRIDVMCLLPPTKDAILAEYS